MKLTVQLLLVFMLPTILLTATAQDGQEPKKVNARPASQQTSMAPAPVSSEPFDGASTASMAGKCVTLETDLGAVSIEMLPEAAPETVRNFLNLAATKAFDTTTFNRVVKGFVVQGGNLATRTGGLSTPQWAQRARRTVPDEPNYVKHERGIVSMARSDQADSATTNFFILVSAAEHLDGKFAAFGRVTKGMDVVDQINKAEVEGEKPAKPVQVKLGTVTNCSPAVAIPVETPE